MEYMHMRVIYDLLGNGSLLGSSTLKMKVVCSAEKFVATYKTTRNHNPHPHFHTVQTTNPGPAQWYLAS